MMQMNQNLNKENTQQFQNRPIPQQQARTRSTSQMQKQQAQQTQNTPFLEQVPAFSQGQTMPTSDKRQTRSISQNQALAAPAIMKRVQTAQQPQQIQTQPQQPQLNMMAHQQQLLQQATQPYKTPVQSQAQTQRPISQNNFAKKFRNVQQTSPNQPNNFQRNPYPNTNQGTNQFNQNQNTMRPGQPFQNQQFRRQFNNNQGNNNNNNNNNYIQQQNIPVEQITVEEGERLLQLWKRRQFVDLNSWCQVSKADVTTKLQENTSQLEKKVLKSYICHVTLTMRGLKGVKVNNTVYNEDAIELKQMGLGKKKKMAKEAALEKLVIELIENGLICRGMRQRDKEVLRPEVYSKIVGRQQQLQQQQQYFMQNKQTTQEEDFQQKKLQNKVHRMSKKIQVLLKENDFEQSCEVLAAILQLKQPDWNEVAFIWSHALLSKNIVYVQKVLSVLHAKRVLSEEEEKQVLAQQLYLSAFDKLTLQDDRDKVTKEHMINNYGMLCRQFTSNPYENFDFYDVEMNDRQIERQGVLVAGEDDQYKEVVRDPFARPLLTSLALYRDFDPSRHVTDIGSLSLPIMHQNHPTLNSVYATDAQAMEDQLQYFTKNFDQGTPYFTQAKRALTTVTHAPIELNTKIGNNNSIKQQSSFNLNSNIVSNQRGGQFEIRDPHTNVLPIKLLLELYDSILYLGDMGFSLQIAELLYTRCKLQYDEFLTTQSTNYFAHRLNLLCVELIEQIFSCFTKAKFYQQNEYLTSVNGTVEKVGTKYTQQVLTLTPNELPEQINNKLYTKQNTPSIQQTEVPYMQEGEFVLLTTNFLPSFDNPILKESYSQLANFVNALQKTHKENQSFINTVTDYGNTVEFALVAQVKEVKDSKAKLYVLPNIHESAVLDDKARLWKITKMTNRNITDKETIALTQFCTQQTMNHLLLQIILSTPQVNAAHLKQLCDTQVTPKTLSDVQNNLNIAQKKALQFASTHLLTLVHCPPGTGKTVTSVEIIAEWLRQQQDDDAQQNQMHNNNRNNNNNGHYYNKFKKQILACCESDQAASTLFNELNRAGIKAVRLGYDFDEDFNGGNDNYASNPKLQYLLQRHKQLQQSPQKLKYFVLKKKLRDADVVVTTPTGVATQYLRSARFPKVLIDDSTKMTEPQILMALTHGTQQVVLFGDPQQMGPHVASNLAVSKGLQISLFERMVREGIKPVMLDTQYRVHPSLMVFPSMAFYENKLLNAVDEAQRPIVGGFHWPNENIRIALISVKGFEQLSNGSLQNTKEVHVLVEVLMQILQEGFIRLNQMSILTPYSAQKRKLKTEINNQAKKYADLFGLSQEEASRVNRNSLIGDIDTIDTFKGTLKDLVFLSTVRCNKNGHIGLIKDPRRLNTVLTKAKRGLIIIGDLETLCYDRNWREFAKFAKKNNIILNY